MPADEFPKFPTSIASGEHILVAAILERNVRKGKRYGFVAVLKPDNSEYHIAEVAHDISTLETFAYLCYTRDNAGALEYISDRLRAGDWTPMNDVQLSSLFSWDR